MIRYMGSKCRLSKWIIENFPEHKTYCEVFGGSGWVLFRKDRSKVEIYNDFNSELVNMFLQIRDNLTEFEQKLKWTLNGRKIFEHAKKHKAISKIDRAVRTASLYSMSFNGLSRCFATNKTKRSDFSVFKSRLSDINDRLQAVTIENLDFEKIITIYDTADTLFYIDPPYLNCEFYYNRDNVHFAIDDHTRLANLLKSIKGKFVISYEDHPQISELYKNFNIINKEVSRTSSTNKKKSRATEMLIMNY